MNLKSRKYIKTKLVVFPILALVFIGAGIGISVALKKDDPKNKKLEVESAQSNVTEVDPKNEQTQEVELNITSADSQYVLVNKKFGLEPVDYRPEDLVIPKVNLTASDSNDEKSVRELITPNLEEMLTAAKKVNLDLTMNSGFRSSKLQAFYFNNYVKQSGLEAAKRYSAEPGHSEHQTGLSFDLSYTDRKCYLDACFGETDAGVWLAENAHSYGFILRYPKDKEEITGYQYEPWHFRFVGKDIATEIFDQKLSYEEYLANLNLISLE
jgi:D-alanyl-D-alanine carboxypeptidase